MIVELSGIDGSGKTTQVARLARRAHEAKIPCYERSLRSTARRVVSGIAAERGHASWQTLFDRNAVELSTALEMHQLVHATIMSIRFPGQLILTDTYVWSWLAAAVAEGSTNLDQLAAIYGTLPAPDLTFELTISVEDAFQRILKRPKGDHLLRISGKDRLARLAGALEAGVEPLVGYPRIRIDGTSAEADIAAQVAEHVLAAAQRDDEALFERLVAQRGRNSQ